MTLLNKSTWIALAGLALVACSRGTPPELSLLSPSDKVTALSSSIQVSGTATDADGVSRITYQINGGPEQTVGISPSTNVTFSFAAAFGSASGNINLRVNAYDQAGAKAQVSRTVLYPKAPNGGNNTVSGAIGQNLPAGTSGASAASASNINYKEARTNFPEVKLGLLHAIIRPTGFTAPANKPLTNAQFQTFRQTLQAVANTHGLKIERLVSANAGYVVFKPATNQSVEQAVNSLRSDSRVLLANEVHAKFPQALPNDPAFNLTWGFRTINAEAAWERTTGSRNIVVGVIDSGIGGRVDLESKRGTHPDLDANLIDGYDFVPCYDMIISPGGPYVTAMVLQRYPRLRYLDADKQCGPDPFPIDEVSLEDQFTISETGSHGTHVAGTIGAVGNNAAGVAGVNWQVSLQPLRGCGSLFCLGDLDAVLYGAGIPVDADGNPNTPETITNPTPARVLNLSLGGIYPYDPVEAEIYRKAVEDQKVVVVAAAGNFSTNEPFYPGSYPWVINVASVDYIVDIDGDANNGQQNGSAFSLDFSNYGPSIDVAAPGGFCWYTGSDYVNANYNSGLCNNSNKYRAPAIYSTGYQWHSGNNRTDVHTYYFNVGTSMASPQVAGAAALILSQNPNLTPYQVRELIRQTASEVNDSNLFKLNKPGRDDYYGWGVLNLAALTEAVATGRAPSNAGKVFVIARPTSGGAGFGLMADARMYYLLSTLPNGTYDLIAGMDANGNGVIGEVGEPYGKYPQTVTLDGNLNLNNLNFELEPLSGANPIPNDIPIDLSQVQRLD